MKKILKGIEHCTKKINHYAEVEDACTNCPYEKEDTVDCEMVCIDKLLLDAKELLEIADRRIYNIEKMLTEWQMVDQRASLLREAELWSEAKKEKELGYNG